MILRFGAQQRLYSTLLSSFYNFWFLVSSFNPYDEKVDLIRDHRHYSLGKVL